MLTHTPPKQHFSTRFSARAKGAGCFWDAAHVPPLQGCNFAVIYHFARNQGDIKPHLTC